MVTKNGKVSAEDAMKQERLVTEVATAVKLQELGISAKLSPESMAMTDYWARELKENPCLIDILERDVNNAVDMLHKAERGEKVELNSKTARNQADAIKSILPKHYYVADEIKTLPNKSTKEFVLVKDAEGKMADVVLPEGASLGMDNDIPGMKKGRIEHALQKEGYETVTFYNVDGSMGYRPDDSFFDGKAVSVARLNPCRRKAMKPSPSTMLMVPWVTVLTTVSLTARQSLLPDSTTGAWRPSPCLMSQMQ